MKKTIIIFTSLIIHCAGVIAQQGNLGDEQINVVKAYQPMLSDAFKISDVPGRDTAVLYIPDMKYEFSSVKFPTVYTISPIKPLRIKDENIKKLYRAFIKAGYGTKNTPYAEFFYNSLRSKTFDAGVHLNYLSSTGKIEDYGYPGMSESGIKLFGTRFFDNSQLGATIGYNRSMYHYYGYLNPPDILSKSSTKHSFDDVYGVFNLKSSNRDKDRFRYDGTLSFYSFTDNKSNEESDVVFAFDFGKTFNEFDLGADIELDFLKYETKNFSAENHTIIRVDPRFVKTFDRMKLTAGANIPIEINDVTKYHLYPHVRLDFNLIDETMSVYGQLTGNLKRNSFRNFSRENPFLGREFALENTNEKLDISAGLNIKIDKQLAFIGSVGLKRINDDAFFRNVDTTSTLVVYDVMYDNNTQTNIHAEVVYDQGEKMQISLVADYFGNKPSREDQPLFRPDFRFGLNGNYVIADKIYFKAQLAYVTQRYYIGYNAPGTAYEYKTIKGYFDANLGVDYRYSKVLSFFVSLNNVTASKYSMWYNYPSYRFGAMAGLSYAF